ncbi:hypothetical protein ACFWVP_04450 [Streptomyces sp. NPDC058637]|uniref:hypothetical protein n=1 Tax=Streptomyces sp. NPDC058637 TaxID=3346569 RepID=UPI0036493E53
MPPEGLLIGEAAARGMGVGALRPYGREGLTPRPAPRPRVRRPAPASGAAAMRVISRNRADAVMHLGLTGLPIAAIREYIAPARNEPAGAKRLDLLERHRVQVVERMERTRTCLVARSAGRSPPSGTPSAWTWTPANTGLRHRMFVIPNIVRNFSASH